MAVVLTTHQLLLVAFFGGLFASVFNRGLVLAWHTAHRLSVRLLNRRESLSTRRKNLQICRAIDALGTTNDPRDNQ
jgi:hypothetical protein